MNHKEKEAIRNKLESLCDEKGVELEIKSNGHAQLRGPLLVNYYPFSKTKTAYVKNTTEGRKNVSPEDAVSMCFKEPSGIKRAKRRVSYKRVRSLLLERGVTKCHWCKEPLTLETSTIEHIVPLSRGGLDCMQNFTLACNVCNEARGSDMPELYGQAIK